MSAPPKSFDPATQAVYDAIANHDNRALPALLDQWLVLPLSEEAAASLFQACCNKQGAGLVRILVDKGLRSNQRALDLALERQCWHVAKAMAPALGRLWGPVDTFQGPEAPTALFKVLQAGQVDVARALLPLYPDPAYAANATLHHLARSQLREVPDAFKAIAWLVEEGADPNQHLVRQTHPLEAALSARNASLGLALVQSGARFSFPHAMRKVIHCIMGCRVDHPQHLEKSRISGQGWDLVEAALASGLRLPNMLQTSWNTHYLEGSDRTTDQLHEDDVARLDGMRQSVELDRSTPKVSFPSRSSRL